MKCEIFWKRIVILCLTLGFGVFVQNFFSLKDLPETPMISVMENKNFPPDSKQIRCIVEDGNLKYEYLIYLKDGEPLISIEEKEKETADLLPGNKKVTPIKTQKVQKSDFDIKSQLIKPSENKAEFQILLHKENCYESNGRE